MSEELQELFQLLFCDNLTASGKRKLKEAVGNLQQKYDKALKLLEEYCPIPFNFSGDIDKYIEQELEKSDKE